MSAAGRSSQTSASPVAIEAVPDDGMHKAVNTLAQAFFEDPMMEWLLPDTSQRLGLSEHFFSIPARFAMRYQAHATQTPRAGGASIWLPPQCPMTNRRLIASGLLGAPFKMGFKTFGRIMGALGVVEKVHKKFAGGPHWYLLAVGVTPDEQGRGLGSALIQEGLSHADRESLPAYLETANPRNIPLYERHGFQIVESVHLGKDGPEAWGMVREAVR